MNCAGRRNNPLTNTQIGLRAIGQQQMKKSLSMEMSYPSGPSSPSKVSSNKEERRKNFLATAPSHYDTLPFQSRPPLSTAAIISGLRLT